MGQDEAIRSMASRNTRISIDTAGGLERPLFSILVTLLVLSEMAFFALPMMPSALYGLCTYARKGLSCILVLMMLIVCQVSESKRNYVSKNSFYGFIGSTVAIEIAIGLIFVFSLFEYNQNISSLFKAYFYYFELLAVIPLSYYCLRFSGALYLCKLYIWLGSFLALYMLLQAQLYNSSGIMIMSTNAIDYAWKFGSVRLMDQSTVNALTALLSFGFALSTRNNIKMRIVYTVLGCISLFTIIVVVQTRAMLFALVISISLALFIQSKDIRLKLLVIVLLVLSSIILSGNISSFFNSFSETPQGTAVRLYGWEYYGRSAFNHLLWGIGLISPDSAVYSSVALGNGSFYPSDLGVLKFVGTFGILGALYYLFVVAQSIRITCLLRKKDSFFFVTCFMLLVYLLLSSVSLGFCDNVRIFYLPFMMALMISSINEESCESNNG